MVEPLEEEFEKFYSALGRITFAWATIDSILDYANHTIYHRYGGKEIEPVLPHSSLEMKIAFLLKCLRGTSHLDDARKKIGIEMGEKLIHMRDERHWMIHGACTGMEGETIRLIRTRLKLKKEERRNVTLTQLADFFDRSMVVAMGLSLFVGINLGKIPPEKLQELLGPFTVELGSPLKGGE